MFQAYMFERGALTPGQKADAVAAFGVMPFGSGEKSLAMYPYTPVETRPAPGMGVWQPPSLRGLGASDSGTSALAIGLWAAPVLGAAGIGYLIDAKRGALWGAGLATAGIVGFFAWVKVSKS